LVIEDRGVKNGTRQGSRGTTADYAARPLAVQEHLSNVDEQVQQAAEQEHALMLGGSRWAAALCQQEAIDGIEQLLVTALVGRVSAAQGGR
jgi:hypothetical protein